MYKKKKLSNCLPCFLFPSLSLSHFLAWNQFLFLHSMRLPPMEHVDFKANKYLISLVRDALSRLHPVTSIRWAHDASESLRWKRNVNVPSRMSTSFWRWWQLSRQKQTVWRSHVSSLKSQLHSAYSLCIPQTRSVPYRPRHAITKCNMRPLWVRLFLFPVWSPPVPSPSRSAVVCGSVLVLSRRQSIDR